jgi:hypothetical protein
MAVEQFRDGRHPTNSMRMPGFPLVGLRSKTSLDHRRFLLKNDADLQRDVQDELRWDPSIHGERIGVTKRPFKRRVQTSRANSNSMTIYFALPGRLNYTPT